MHFFEVSTKWAEAPSPRFVRTMVKVPPTPARGPDHADDGFSMRPSK
jgi:hypothetical protein